LLIGYAVAALLPAHAAVAGILVGALADPVAASVGERFGGGRAKSWPGFAAALAMGWGGLSVLGLPVPVVIAAGAVGAACERWAVAVDDNLVVAPAVGATVALLT
jgi:dolichol kinase